VGVAQWGFESRAGEDADRRTVEREFWVFACVFIGIYRKAGEEKGQEE